MKYNNTSGRYTLLDELRGLDLVSMMLYHGCWDLVNLFGIQADWYYGLPGHLWQQSICWVFILLSGFCVQLGHHTLRRGAQVFGAGALVTAVTLLFMPEDRVVFGVLTLLGSAMLLTGLLEKPLRRIPPAAGFAISAVLFALTRNVSVGYLGFGSLRLWLPQTLYANYVTAYFGFYPWWVLFYGLFCPSAVAVSILGGVLSLRRCRAAAHGALAPLGLPAAGLAWTALAAAVSVAPAGHLRGAAGSVPRIGQLKRTLCVLQKGGIVVPCKHCANTLTSRAGLWYPVDG